MKKSSATYRAITKSTAVLLLMAFLIPTGLQAKDLVEFCMMEMSNHQSTQTTTSDSSHHCDTEPAEEQDEHPNCDWGFICACNIGQSHLSQKDWVPTHKDAEVILSESEILFPFFSSTQVISAEQQPRIDEHTPPLWLLYDTLLM